MRWWGWGVDEDAVELPASAEHLLDLELGLGAESRPRVVRGGPDDVALPRSALDAGARAALVRVVGEEHVTDDHATRVSRAAGRSYPDLLALRRGRLESAPDAVVRPADGAQVAGVLAACSAAGVAVVPFGGGTSVVGGVDAVRGAHAAAISLDLTRMDRVLDLDRVSLTARLEPGILGPELERRLSTAGLSLGHYPQSFEYSTLGGWLATRSAGQASTGLGRIDELVQAVRCETPAGPIETRDVPASAAGPSLRELIVGSEGTLGVITAATMKLRPLPASRRYEAWSFASFTEGSVALRALAQAGAAPDVSRLSDERETALTVALGSTGSRAERMGRAYLRLRGHDEGCLMIAGFEGSAGDVARRRGRAAEMLRAAGGVHLGERPGRAWERTRYGGPNLRDVLMDRGALVETLETATTWSGLEATYGAVRDALTESLAGEHANPLVMCHLSHLYRTGACLYFTFIAPARRGAELEQWRAAKGAALDAIMATGATVTHHHAVGRDHQPWMAAEVGETGLEALRALKGRLDPRGIMNPGKLLA
jgi:alkyldihydroxyacetonephosphate synthase